MVGMPRIAHSSMMRLSSTVLPEPAPARTTECFSKNSTGIIRGVDVPSVVVKPIGIADGFGQDATAGGADPSSGFSTFGFSTGFMGPELTGCSRGGSIEPFAICSGELPPHSLGVSCLKSGNEDACRRAFNQSSSAGDASVYTACSAKSVLNSFSSAACHKPPRLENSFTSCSVSGPPGVFRLRRHMARRNARPP